MGSSGTSHHAPTYRVLKRCAYALGFVLFDPRRLRGLVGKISSNLAPTYRVLKRCAYALGSPIFHLWWAQVEHRVTLRRTAYLNAVRMRSALFCLIPAAYAALVGSSGLEPPTSRLSGARSNQLSYEPVFASRCFSFHLARSSVPGKAGGDDGIRTHDPLLAGQVLSQLSYTPACLADSDKGFPFLSASPCGVLAPSSFPRPSPAKYLRHCTA